MKQSDTTSGTSANQRNTSIEITITVTVADPPSAKSALPRRRPGLLQRMAAQVMNYADKDPRRRWSEVVLDAIWTLVCFGIGMASCFEGHPDGMMGALLVFIVGIFFTHIAAN